MARLLTYTLLGAILIPMTTPSTSASEEYSGQFNYGQAEGKGQDWIQTITVLQPAYRSTVNGLTTITFSAAGMDQAEARCWHPPDASNPSPWGYDAVVMPARTITGQDAISFDFPADEFPHGPIHIRIATQNAQGKRDLCELQLFNAGGVRWNQGIPDTPPPAAEGLQLIFADDFETMPSISRLGLGTTYMGHKPPDGSQDFSGWRFSHKDDYAGAHDPYEQAGTWLRLKARAEGTDSTKWGTAIFSPVDIDYNGVTAMPPFYMECRFMAHSVPGAWPAFWTLTVPNPNLPGGDELDIIEGYGGVGPGNPNDTIGYHCVSHFWRQDAVTKSYKERNIPTHTRVPMMELGGKSYWSTTFHTYGLYVDEKDTIYYCDNIEVLRHPTGPISAVTPAFFMVNYAIGGISGWKIDVARYGNATDMWVDYVRVYSATPPPPAFAAKTSYLVDESVAVTVSTTVPQAKIHFTVDGSDPTASSPVTDGTLTIDKPCTIKAVVIREGMKPSRIISAEVKAAFAAQNPTAAIQPGLRCDYYEGEWRKVPDFSSLTPKATTVTPTVVFPAQHAEDHFALRYSGFIDIPTKGLYTFFTTSDDGSLLFIDGQLIVDNDGLHGAIERKGSVGLLPGKHRIEVGFFEASGGDSLVVSWQGPGLEKAVVPAAVLSTAVTTE